MTTITVDSYPEQESYWRDLASAINKARESAKSPKQRYSEAYSLWRASKGSACLSSNHVTRAAWKTYIGKFWFNQDGDPISIIDVAVYAKLYKKSYVKHKIALLYHFNTDYRLSVVGTMPAISGDK